MRRNAPPREEVEAVTNEGADVRKRREAVGLSPEQLGGLAGVSGSTVRRFEDGMTASRLSTRHRILRALERAEKEDDAAWSAQTTAAG